MLSFAKPCGLVLFTAFILTGLTTMTHAQTSQPSADIKTLAADTNAFAADLYGRLSGEKGNLFFSPYSIESALAMVYGGPAARPRRRWRAFCTFLCRRINSNLLPGN